LIKALIDALELTNKFRDLTGADNYLGGRDPYKTDSGIVNLLLIFLRFKKKKNYDLRFLFSLMPPTF